MAAAHFSIFIRPDFPQLLHDAIDRVFASVERVQHQNPLPASTPAEAEKPYSLVDVFYKEAIGHPLSPSGYTEEYRVAKSVTHAEALDEPMWNMTPEKLVERLRAILSEYKAAKEASRD